jgi:hypothetical protein
VKDVWLGGEAVGSCADLSYYCKETEAALGEGIAVRWPASFTAVYSR